MSHADLRAAANAAHYLSSMAASIHALQEAGMIGSAFKHLSDELHGKFDEMSAAIRAVEKELQLVRGCSVARFGDIRATTAHGAAVEMVYALWREKFKGFIEVIGHPEVRTWPDVRDVSAEIELETTKAKAARLSLAATAGGTSERPRWDGIILSYKGWRIHKRSWGVRQRALLDALQTQNWPSQIELPQRVTDASEVTRTLNNAIGEDAPLKFFDAGGKIAWQAK